MKQYLFIALLLAGECISGTNHVSKSGPPEYFNDIQSAVDISTNAGDVILIHDGTYLLSEAVTISEPIVLKGLNGPSGAIIDGGNQTHCFQLEDVDCILSGLVIRNGINDSGAGGIDCGNNGTPVITNCIITGCSGVDGGGIAGGTVIHSIIRENSAQKNGGGAWLTHLYDSLVVDNVASNDFGGGVYGGILYNCTVVGNEAGTAAGGVDGCGVYNSIIFDNLAPDFPDLDPEYNDTLEYSCSADLMHGVDGNITNAPMFIDSGSGNFRLSSISLCIDSGNELYAELSVDLDGNSRIYGGTVDMGAYEVQASEQDQDGDNVPDAWEVQYFGGIDTSPEGHGDADAFNNWQEYIAGTDPTNSESFFAITNYSAGSFIVEWEAVPGREYRVLWTDSFTNEFTEQAVLDYPRGSYTDTAHNAENTGFYKVDVQLK